MNHVPTEVTDAGSEPAEAEVPERVAHLPELGTGLAPDARGDDLDASPPHAVRDEEREPPTTGKEPDSHHRSRPPWIELPIPCMTPTG